MSLAGERKPTLFAVGDPPDMDVTFLTTRAAEAQMEPTKAIPKVAETDTQSKSTPTFRATVLLLHGPPGRNRL